MTGTYETSKHEQVRIEQAQAKNGREMFLLTLNQDKAIEREEER